MYNNKRKVYILRTSNNIICKNNKKFAFKTLIRLHKTGYKRTQKFTYTLGYKVKSKDLKTIKIFVNNYEFSKWSCLKNVEMNDAVINNFFF